MIKRILSLLLSIFVLTANFAVCPVSAAESAKVPIPYVRDFLDLIGINTDTHDDSYVTRAEFAYMIIKAINSDAAVFREGVFSDVYDVTKYDGYIIRAYELGIAGGNGTGLFMPEEAVTADAAVKMAISALGYGDIVSAMGGYPYGYYEVARRLDMLDGIGVSGATKLKYEDAAAFIFNFLTSSTYDISGIYDEELKYELLRNKSVLNTYFNLARISGVVKTAGYTTMVPARECEESRVEIGGQSFRTDIGNIRDYLGFNVDAWYDETTSTLKLICVKPENSMYSVNADDIESVSDGRIVFFTADGKEAKLSLNASCTFVRNGRVVEHSPADFVMSEGSFDFIDNTGDRCIDVVIARRPEYMTVSYVDINDGIVYDNSGAGKSAVVKCEDDVYTEYFTYDDSGVVSSVGIRDIKPDTALTLYRSDNGKYTYAVLSDKKLSGVVTEKSNDGLFVDGVSYRVNSNFGSLDRIKIGEEYVLLLAHDGTVTEIAAQSPGIMKYGYFINFGNFGNGLVSKYQMAILSSDGDIISAELADKINFDGIMTACDDIGIQSTFIKNNLPDYQLIKYKLSANGKIIGIDTLKEYDESLTPEDNFSTGVQSDDSLMRFLKSKKSYWYGSYRLFAPETILGDNTIMISVPEALKDGITQRYDDECFTVIQRSDLSSWGNYWIDTYDAGGNLTPAVIVVYNPDAGTGGSVKENADSGIVSAVTVVADRHGSETLAVTYYRGDKYFKNCMSHSCFTKLTAANTPAVGDIIRFSTDSYGEIISYTIDVKYDDADKSAVITSDAPAGGQTNVNYYSGKSLSHTSNTLSIIVDGYSGFSTGASDPIFGDVAAFRLDSSFSANVFDTKTKKVYPASIDKLADALAVGRENATRVVFRSYMHSVLQLFIYE